MKSVALLILLAALATLSALAVLVPAIRNPLRQILRPPFRTILSTLTADLTGSGERMRILKVQTELGLFLEIYNSPQNSPGLRLLHTLKLPDRRDGYFQFRGHATNLALEDVDGSLGLEIIAPSYGEDMVAHLNVYKFDSATQKLISLEKSP